MARKRFLFIYPLVAPIAVWITGQALGRLPAFVVGILALLVLVARFDNASGTYLVLAVVFIIAIMVLVMVFMLMALGH